MNAKRCAETGFNEPDYTQMRAAAEQISETAGKYGFTVASCEENIDLNGPCIEHNSCIDREPFERLIGSKLAVLKDKNRRKE